MAPREITVRITAEGRIVFDMAGASQEEIRLMRAMAEEVLGRVEAEGPSPEPPPPARVLADVPPQRRLRSKG